MRQHFIPCSAWLPFARALVFGMGMLLTSQVLQAQTTQFTYQGLLNDGGSPASGTYDLQFRLFDALSGGVQIGGTLTIENVVASNGIFKVTLDFGAAAFPGANRWLEIGVRPGASTGAFTTLSPLQPLTSTPYAIRSLNAATAATAATADGLSAACVNCVTSAQINTVQGAQVTGNIAGSQITGAIPVASVPAGSSAYVQNSSSVQASANFNVSGNGTVGGTLSANIVNAATQFRLGGFHILSAPPGNLLAGNEAGAALTSGAYNSFFGTQAGASTTSATANSFFGHQAGQHNTTGTANSFFGNQAGTNNLTGSHNSFFGIGTGQTNSTADSNSFFGATTGTSNTTGHSNAFFGRSAGYNNLDGYRNSFYGTGTGTGNTSGYSNSFFGNLAGQANTTGTFNTLLGTDANLSAGNLNFATAIGAGAVVSSSNTMVLGRSLGQDAVNVPGSLTVVGALTANGSALTNLNANNIASGTLAVARGGTGLSSAGGVGNYLRSNGTAWVSSAIQAADLPSGNTSYIQNTTTQQAGSNFNISGNGTVGGTLAASAVSASLINATTQYNLGGTRVLGADGVNNLIAGIFAGTVNTGVGNSFFGGEAGRNNTSGDNNSFVGRLSGQANSTGFNNSFFGSGAGNANTTASWNSFFGHNAGWANTTGALNSFFGDNAGLSNTTGSDNNFFGRSAGALNSTGFNNTFFGSNAGRNNTTGDGNAFFGNLTGGDNTTGLHNAFFGFGAGAQNTFANDNAYFGFEAGTSNTTGANNAFFGKHAGRANVLGGNNAFFGFEAGLASTATWNSFFGYRAGYLNTTGVDNTFVGDLAGQSNTTGNNNTVIGDTANVGFPNLSYATAIGAEAYVYTSNTVALGRAAGQDTVKVPGKVVVDTLGAAGSTTLCRNASNEISTCSSSQRYKDRILAFNGGLKVIQRLQPVTFQWKASGAQDLGLIAEEVAKVDPLLVTYNEKGEIEGVKYEQLSVVLINALKQQQTQIEQQAQKNVLQQQQLQQQQDEIQALKRLVCRTRSQAAICRAKQ